MARTLILTLQGFCFETLAVPLMATPQGIVVYVTFAADMGLTGLTLLLDLFAVVMVLMVAVLLNTGKIIRLVGPDVLEVFVKVLGVVPAAI